MFIHVPKKIINELILRTNIIDLINQKIPLKKQGINFVACCPFHKEKYPSFTVNAEKKFYYCFSCGAHGNIINFLMNYDQLTFIESIQKLSSIHNITIENFIHKTHNTIKIKKNKSLYKFMEDVCTYYQNNLIKKKYLHAYKYLKKRGINNDSISNFKIGFAPIGWNNIIQNLNNIKSYDQKIINQSGMWVRSNHKNQYDRFRERIMFPMRDELGRIIAFGGRIIQNKTNYPKYLNSPDTNIFQKKQYLYGFYEIRKNHKNVPYILLVEGYTDVITLSQFGINYAVASLGTCISTYHIQLMYGMTNQIICCYDGDHAGKQAAWRIFNSIIPYLTDKREIYFMFLPNKEDPDTLIRRIGKNEFLKKVFKSQSLSYFLFDTIYKKINLQTLEGRVKLSRLVLPILEKIPGKILKFFLLHKLSIKVGILDYNKLNQLLSKKTYSINHTKNKNYIKYNIEHILIGLLIQNPKLAKLVPTIKGLEKCGYKKITIFINLIKLCKKYPNIQTEQLLTYYYKKNINNCSEDLKMLASWKHRITNSMISIIFIDTLTQLYNVILERRQNALISQDRILGLNQEERKELWLLNQTLSIH